MTTLVPTGKSGLSTLFAAAARKVESTRGKLIFGFDATASREPAWAASMELQRSMFQAASALEVQLAVFSGTSNFLVSHWETDPTKLVDLMNQITCNAGVTQIRRLLDHVLAENTAGGAKRPVNALVFIGDTFEESTFEASIMAASRAMGDLRIPGFFFLDSSATHSKEPNPYVERFYKEMAKLSGGAYAPFDLNAIAFLSDLLKGVAAFASGGLTALSNQNTSAAKLLLSQVKKG